jgi:hypothetical protein
MADKEVALYIRYPRRGWILFDMQNFTAQHQRQGLEAFIESGKDSMYVSIPHAIGGLFQVSYNKTLSKGENQDNDIILYSYTTMSLDTVQMIYATPEYIAYVNRITT